MPLELHQNWKPFFFVSSSNECDKSSNKIAQEEYIDALSKLPSEYQCYKQLFSDSLLGERSIGKTLGLRS